MTVPDTAAEQLEFGSEESSHVASVENRERIYTAQWGKPRPVEVRASGNGRTIGGYAFVHNSESENLGGYTERIAQSFANKSRGDGWPGQSGGGVVCRYNHNDELVLGTTRSGTLKLSLDEIGLSYDVDVPECRSDVLEMVGRRDVAHSSFAFRIDEEEWGVSNQNFPLRTLVSGKIIDVAPVLVPAYRDTSVALRSLAKHLDVPYEDVRKLSKQNELRKFFVRTDGEPAKPKPRLTPQQAKMRSLAKRPNDPIAPL
jgi:HK97 family phage prohead protease